MPRLTPERLRLFALDALEEAVADGEFGPVRRTWALRLALGYLSSLHPRMCSRAEPYQDFWRALSLEGRTMRILAMEEELRIIYAWVDVKRDHDRAALIRERARQLREDAQRENRPEARLEPTTLCNRYRRAIALGQIDLGFTEISEIRIPLRFPEGRPNLQDTDICITDTGTIIRADSDGAPEMVQRRWSWPGPTGKPVFNYRSEGREFASGRCLIVATGFYEFTAARSEGEAAKRKAKDRWLFTKTDEPWFCIAGLWRTHPGVGEAFTMLTCEPGPDVAPYHNRQVAVLDRAQWRDWLDPHASAKGMIRPLRAGSLAVEHAAS